MSDLKNLFLDKKNEITQELEVFLKTTRQILDKKNKEIISLKDEVNKKKAINVKPTLLVGNVIEFLLLMKKNNKISRKLVNKCIKINEIKNNQEQQSTINTSEFEAFKVIVMKLEEEKKDNENNKNIIKTLEEDKQKLIDEIDILNKDLESSNVKLETLSSENSRLNGVNKAQYETIENLKNELKDKVEKINEVKNYFLEIMVDYNDIIQEAE